MMILAIIYSSICVTIAALHLLWALGVWFPIKDERGLVAAAVGIKGVTRMPGAVPCALVVVALLFAAVAPWWSAGGLRNFVLGCSALIFLGRGAAAYLPLWRRLTPQEPFATNDLRYYGPLCIFLGISAALLLF